MLYDKFRGKLGKAISYLLILTTHSMTSYAAYASDDFNQAVSDANVFASQLFQQQSTPVFDNSGSLIINGEVYMSPDQLTGQRDDDYLPSDPTGSYGNDSATLMQAQVAQDKYDEKTFDTAETSGEKAYHMVTRSFARQKPDLTNDPIWSSTDNIFDNLVEIAGEFADCTVSTELVTTGDSYHVPVYKICERLPYREEKVELYHDYKVGIIKHNAGAMNLASCGDGCTSMWIGTVGDNYWSGWCTIFEEEMSVEILQPDVINQAKITYAKFDDWFQIWLNENKVYNAPYGDLFPPETSGECELSTSWEKRPNIDVTDNFREVAVGTVLNFKTRTSVAGDGEGYAKIELHYDPKNLVYDETWSGQDAFDRAIAIINNKDINADGMCTVTATCKNQPTLNEDGCTEINGIYACESNFKENKFAPFDISPFCKRVEVSLSCGFNDGEFCTTNMDGLETCVDSSDQVTDYNQCKKYEEDANCSFISSECVQGAEGDAGGCYVQEDTYDCGFNASNETTTEDQVIRCDGKLQCVGESCYSPVRDAGNTNFAQTAAYLEMLRYAKSDMTCEGAQDRPYDPDLPPDMYHPVPSCPASYTYDLATDTCLKSLRCTYSDNDFYAASPRNGIQILRGNSVVANDPSIPVCTTVIKSGTAYACGEIQKKLATDSFYEVCENQITPVTPNTCPSPSHALNPQSGMCEVPPIASCPDGYDLYEGQLPFDKTDDICIAPREPSNKICNDGYVLNVDDVCQKDTYTNPWYTCPSGHTLNGTTCSLALSTPVSYSCNAGWTPSGQSHCQKYTNPHSPSKSCSSGNKPSICASGAMLVNSATCQYKCNYSGGNGTNSTYWTGNVSYTCNGAINIGGTCYNSTTVNANKNCPSGYTLTGNTCYKNESSAATANCPSGHVLNGNTCLLTEYENSTPECNDNFVLSSDKTECIRDPEKVTPVYDCPSSYPLWDEAEGRCRSKSLNPLANVMRLIESSELYELNSTELMSYALSPYKDILGHLVPTANASDVVTPAEPVGITKESMMEYISSKIGQMSDEFESNKDMYALGQNQLMSYASSMQTPQTMSVMRGGGQQNVTCELFQGGAAECKVAVGGFQDCCESPAATTLNDYITLTRTMIEMDALTGQVMGLENYSGVWEIASTWTAEASTTAWQSVQGLFSTAADGVAAAGTDVAADGATGVLAQSMMDYSRDFLFDVFGEEVMKMFFTSSTGDAVATQALAGAGTALMYVYYAYLAYVVFNLLVNIIYECEEEEFDLAMKVELLSAHAIGTYCKSEVLGMCLEKRRVYCSFDSPLSRIIMQQAYMQPHMNLSWGTPRNPNCQGLNVEDIAKIDWDKVNLDEWVGILISTDNYIGDETIDVERLTGTGSGLNSGDRDNVIERNQSRMAGMDLDEVKRDAYEASWNDLK